MKALKHFEQVNLTRMFTFLPVHIWAIKLQDPRITNITKVSRLVTLDF